MESKSRLDIILLAAVVLVLAGWGVIYLVTGIQSEHYAFLGLGLGFLLGAAVSPIAKQFSWARLGLVMLTCILTALFVNQAYNSANFFLEFTEHSLMMGAPLVLAMWWSKKGRPAARQLAIFLTVGTFLGHGLYALGWDRESTNFVEIVVKLLDVEKDSANVFLVFFGALDVIAAVALMTGYLARISLVYMVIWGFVTAFARFFFNLEEGGGMIEALVETGIRLVHGLIPLWLALLAKSEQEEAASE